MKKNLHDRRLVDCWEGEVVPFFPHLRTREKNDTSNIRILIIFEDQNRLHTIWLKKIFFDCVFLRYSTLAIITKCDDETLTAMCDMHPRSFTDEWLEHRILSSRDSFFITHRHPREKSFQFFFIVVIKNLFFTSPKAHPSKKGWNRPFFAAFTRIWENVKNLKSWIVCAIWL